ncbi:MAG: helix-turn-helix domain-containing protein [Flavobacteriales bacterium]
MMTFGNNIKKIRKTKNLSQAGFAEIFDLKRATLGAYEEGRSLPKLDTVIKIAHHFGISIDKLLTKEITVNQLSKFDDNLLIGKSTEKIKDKILYLPKEDLKEYCKTPDKKEFQNKLERIEFPFIYLEKGIAIELDEKLNGYPEGTILIGKRTRHPKFEQPIIGIKINGLEILKELPKNEKEIIEYWVLEGVYTSTIPEIGKNSDISLEDRLARIEKHLNL